MRRTFIAAAAMVATAYGHARAADLPAPSIGPPLPVAVYNWTGFYLVGINGGFGTGNSNWSDGPMGATGGFPISGFLVGGTVGINYQIGAYVFGIEGDGDWTNLRGNSGSTCGAIAAVVPPPISCQTQSQWLARRAAASAMPSTASFFTARPAPLSAISKPVSTLHRRSITPPKRVGRSGLDLKSPLRGLDRSSGISIR